MMIIRITLPRPAIVRRIGSRLSSSASRWLQANIRWRLNQELVRPGRRRTPPPRPPRPARSAAPPAPARRPWSFCVRLFQVADEGLFQRRRVPPLDHPGRRVDDQHLAGVHQRDAVAALGLVHEVRGDEDRDLVAAGQLDQVLPEAVAGHRIDARGRLVEDQQVGLVDQRHGQLQALPLSQRERVGQRIHDLVEAEPRGRLFDALRDLVLRARRKSRACRTRFCRTVSSE